MKAQFRLAAKLKQQEPPTLKAPGKKTKFKHEPLIGQRKRTSSYLDDDVPMSSEMRESLRFLLSGQDDSGLGILVDNVSSAIQQPLNALSVYCPNAAVAESQFSALRSPNTQDFNTTNDFSGKLNRNETGKWENTFSKSSFTQSKQLEDSNVSNDDSSSRLEVLWLQRKAQLEKDSGAHETAVKTLDKALLLHLGSNDYLKANILQYTGSSDPSELLEQIEEKYIIYDPSVHVKVIRIQRSYRKYMKKKTDAATVLSRFYRGHLVRKFQWVRMQLIMQCAHMIQKVVRAHNYRRFRLVKKLQRWYRMRKAVRVFNRLRDRYIYIHMYICMYTYHVCLIYVF
jgi:hypothetical protein